jgi:hypothetical protein
MTFDQVLECVRAQGAKNRTFVFADLCPNLNRVLLGEVLLDKLQEELVSEYIRLAATYRSTLVFPTKIVGNREVPLLSDAARRMILDHRYQAYVSLWSHGDSSQLISTAASLASVLEAV